VNVLYKDAQTHVSILAVLTVIVLSVQLVAETRRTRVRYSLIHLLSRVQLQLITGCMETDATGFNCV
jgi:hypothetical protein